jgi:hypothetical protein
VADSIVRVVRDASRPPRLSAAVPMRRRAVRDAHGELLALAADLRAGEADVVLAQRLLVDVEGPLYWGDADLREVVRLIRQEGAWMQ